jgi:hypothetical protein
MRLAGNSRSKPRRRNALKTATKTISHAELLMMMMVMMMVGSWDARCRQTMGFLIEEPCHDPVEAGAVHEIGEDEGRIAASDARVPVHHCERSAYVRGEVDFVDHEQPATLDARPALARNLVAARDIDDIDERIH